MLNQPTLEKLEAMRSRMDLAAEPRPGAPPHPGQIPLSGQPASPSVLQNSGRLGRFAGLGRGRPQPCRANASVEDIDFRLARGLDRSLVRSLTQNSAWVHQHQQVFLVGPTGVGKTWLACALAEKACRRFGFGPRRRQPEQLSGSVAQDRRAGRQRLAQFGLGGSRTPRLPRDLRRPLPAAFDHPHQPDSRQALARANRRSHSGRQPT